MSKKPLWTSAEIAAAVKGTCTGKWQAEGVSIDTRTVKPGDLFVALQGPNHDAHDFVGEAINKGAAGALVSYIPRQTPAEKLVLAKDTMVALQALGFEGRRRSHAKIIAVTGSVGKTGCKEALKQVLSAQALSFASAGSYNNHWGVPLSLSQMPQATAYGIFEIGMNHAGELGPLSKLVRPHIALITGIAAVHLGYFKDLKEIAKAKAEIFEGIEKNGTAVLNGDDTHFEQLKEAARAAGVKNILRFGRGAGFEAKLEEHALEAEQSRVKATIMGQSISYTIAAPGEHWVMNSLAVLLCAQAAGADLKKAADAFRTLALAEGRGGAQNVNLPGGGGITVVDESYNASPVAVEAAIRVLSRREPGPGGRRILVLGDMKELGEESRKLHVNLAPAILQAKISLVFACGDMMRDLFEALPENLRGAWCSTSGDLAPRVTSAMKDGDVVTVKGSHSMAMDRIVQALVGLQTPFVKQSAG
jgi:UDP-N-acetylmuramoyl-tripeptide--D-alanyl-D-alanine ligase